MAVDARLTPAAVQVLDSDQKCPLCRVKLAHGRLDAYKVNYAMVDIISDVCSINLERYRLRADQVVRGSLLGRGGFGCVFEGMSTSECSLISTTSESG
jgi:hypothetical protein